MAFPVISAPGAYLISRLQVAALTEVRHLKEGGAYVKVRWILYMKFQNLLIFTFQNTIDTYHYES